jgi:hypothetical protein
VPVVPLSLVGGTSNTSSRLDPAPEPQRDHTLRQQGPQASPLSAGHPAAPTKPAGKMRQGCWGCKELGIPSAVWVEGTRSQDFNGRVQL